MEARVCSNVLCGTSSSSSSSSSRWVRGWPLRSGGFANLCHHCGSAYEQSVFCYTFHLKESGWRDCDTCSTRLHCGCVASKTLLVLTDNGGVQCISCAKRLEIPFISIDETPDGISMTANSSIRELQLTSDYKLDGDHLGMGKLVNLCNVDGRDHNGLLQSQKDDTNGFSGMIKREQTLPSFGELGPATFPNFNGTSFGSTQTIKQNNHRESVGVKDMYDSLSQTCLTMTIGAPSGNANFAKPIACAASEERDQSKMSASLQQVQRSRPRTSKTGHGTAAESSKDNFPQLRVARPPVEGRGRNQLLPRYWPRITDQELQQISGDSNSTITPLFEKVLSASDAGRIGRLVLPKACAEAYFPPISQPEGLPLRIQDVKGKEWHFQFRFWPNNNSRMYVLEGVTPCIQSMQLQAGDTVTFSRLDPEGKLVMGFRKASNCVTLKDTQMTAVANGSNENFFSGSVENFGYAGLLQPLKGSNVLSEHLRSTDGDANLCKIDKHGGLSLQAIPIPEKKRSRNIGSKSKRLLIDAEDALELKFTWEEAHDLLRPPPSVNPSIVRIDDYEFEEYEEPPIFGKRSIFTSRSSGGQDQWVQCDSCSKWRRLPVDVLLPAKWSCSDNAWDSKRYSCGAPNELSPTEVDNLLKMNVDFKRRKVDPEPEPSGLDALATAAVESFVATTTKHPRHRIGCTCIVCIQPPSGKGPKHKPTCTCNVCMTVKRRFKTLMMRKKKRQSDKEAAEVAAAAAAANSKQQQQLMQHAMEMEVESAASGLIYAPQPSNDQGNNSMEEKIETGIDLNCDPEGREDDGVSMMSLLQVANQPLETYLRQNGLASLTTEQQSQQEQEQDHHVDSAAGEEED